VACGWRIRHKLMLGMGLVGAIMALMLAGTLKGLASYQATRRTIDSKLNELQWAENLHHAAQALGEPCSSFENQGAELLGKVREVRKALAEYANRLESTVNLRRDPDHGLHEKGTIEALENRLDKLTKELLRVTDPMTLKSGRNLNADLAPSGSPIRDDIDKVIRTAEDLINSINEDLRQRLKKAKADYTVSLTIVLSTSAAAILLMIGLFRFFYRWVFYPIRDLEAGVGRVARGDFEHTIAVNSGDEIEDLAKAFNDMTGRLREMYRDLAQQVNERSRQLVRSERLAGVGFLAAGVAHEINNPLAGIAFCSEALKRRLAELFTPGHFQSGAAGGVQQERDIFTKYLNMIEEEAFRCKNITQKLLAFSRGSEKRREPTIMGDLVQGVLDMVQHHENCRGKEMAFQPGPSVEAWINGQEVKQVFLNLVMNSLDSMDEGGKLTITQTLKGDMVELVFKDTGCGMTTEVLENIFEPFFTRSRSGKGTGLGLSISHQIIAQHGGEIEASSAGPGQGSTFIVRLPLKPPLDVKDQGQPDPPEVEFKKFAQKRPRKAA
jgi:two-component system NtrC family sensor kinase